MHEVWCIGREEIFQPVSMPYSRCWNNRWAPNVRDISLLSLTMLWKLRQVWHVRESRPCGDLGWVGFSPSKFFLRDSIDSELVHHHAGLDDDFRSLSPREDGAFGTPSLLLPDGGSVLDPTDHLQFSSHYGLLATTNNGQSFRRKGAGNKQSCDGCIDSQNWKWRAAWLCKRLGEAMGSKIPTNRPFRLYITHHPTKPWF